MAPTRISLAQQIAQLEEPAPADYDPEDLQSQGAEINDDMRIDLTGSREHYVDVGPSDLRNKLPSIAHPKYEGIRVSRSQLLQDSDDGHEDEEEEEKEEDGQDGGQKEREDDNDEIPSENSENEGSQNWESADREPSESEAEESEDSEGETSISKSSQQRQTEVGRENFEDLASTLKKTRENDLTKGQAIKRQIAVWDTLLDTRIRLQKSILSANRLPPPSEIKAYLQDASCYDAISGFLNEASSLADEILELQENLLKQNNIVELPPRKRRRLDAEAPSIEEYSDSVSAASANVVVLEQVFHPYLLQTLSKWSSKIQAVAPSVLLPSNRGTFLKGSQSLKSVVQLIDENLAEHDKLLARTQVARVKKSRIGANQQETDKDEEDALDAEVFDDTDFYQKLLRDIIDSRGNGTKNEDWMVIQKQKKAKKKVDTKASKGRKLRYEVHEKLQNFMVPVPNSAGAWHEEQVDELFASLLGKGFEGIEINSEDVPVDKPVELGGFRVFG